MKFKHSLVVCLCLAMMPVHSEGEKKNWVSQNKGTIAAIIGAIGVVGVIGSIGYLWIRPPAYVAELQARWRALHNRVEQGVLSPAEYQEWRDDRHALAEDLHAAAH